MQAARLPVPQRGHAYLLDIILQSLFSPLKYMNIENFMDATANRRANPDATQTPDATLIPATDVRTFIERTEARLKQLGFSPELSARLLSPRHNGVEFNMEA